MTTDLRTATDAEICSFYAADREIPKHVAGRKRKPLFREHAVTAAVTQLDCDDVLDVGCGDGHLAELMARCGIRVHVADVVEANVAEARRRIVRADAAQDPRSWVGLVEDLGFVRAFDAVTCCETIEHVRDPARALANLARAARRLVVITTPVGRCYDDPSHLHHWDDGPALIEALEVRRHFSEVLVHEFPSRLGDEGLIFMLMGLTQ